MRAEGGEVGLRDAGSGGQDVKAVKVLVYEK
ncbi:hypothetical protein SAMN04490370_102261 [Eubacterium ruminantium]|nr:hypothetical protein SAMN04490370_102261 [Eubacterium ruminantium]